MENDTLDVKETVLEDSSTSKDEGGEAKPSGAKDAKTLADVVRETVAAAKSSESSTEKVEEASEDVAKTEPNDDKEVSEESEKTEEEKAKTEKEEEVVLADKKDEQLPFHKHKRFQELTRERLSFKQKAESLEPVAKRAQAIDEYCQKHGISDEEFNSAIQLTALLHTDPPKALEALRAYVETLEVSMGNKLPTDLQKEVDDGALSPERAKEIANLRVKASGLEHTGKRSEAQIAQERQSAITNAVNSWDQQKRSSDTAYDKKYPLIEKSFIALCTMNPPKSPQEAIALAEKAYAEVNTALGTFTPKPPQRKVLKTNGSVTKGVIDIKPGMNLKEALPLIARKVIAEHSR